MKKLIAMLLALVMVLGLVAAATLPPQRPRLPPQRPRLPPPRLLPITPPLRAVFTT